MVLAERAAPGAGGTLLCNTCINSCVSATTVAAVLPERLSCLIKLFPVHSLLWYNSTTV